MGNCPQIYLPRNWIVVRIYLDKTKTEREREGESISVATQFAMKVFLHSIQWNINADFRWTLKDKSQSVTSQGVKWLPRKKLNHFRVYEWRMIFLLDGTRSSDQFTACNSPRIFVRPAGGGTLKLSSSHCVGGFSRWWRIIYRSHTYDRRFSNLAVN